MAVLRNTTLTQADLDLMEEMGRFYADPLGHVMFSYPWHKEKTIQIVKLPQKYRERFDSEYGPDLWACEMLDEIGEAVKSRNFDGVKAVMPIQFATVSGHGIGKSVICAWITKWIMDTRPMAKGKITSGRAEQLRGVTWAELGKWHNLSLTKHLFDFTSSRGSMILKHKLYGDQWKCEGTTAKAENAQAFAGQHAVNSTSFYIFDEASIIPDEVFIVRQGGLTDGEPMTFDFGNGTRNSGYFYEECVANGRYRRNMYNVREIDSRTVAITNKMLFNQWVKDHGENSDFVKVRVRGMFPSTGSIQFIGTGDISNAANRELPVESELRKYPVVLGVDVARYGDCETVIYPRRGPDARSLPIRRYTGLKTTHVVRKIVEEVRLYAARRMPVKAVFVDGSGIGGAVVDQLQDLALPCLIYDVKASGSTAFPEIYHRKADECWGTMRQEIENRLCIPSVYQESGAELQRQLSNREYGIVTSTNAMKLEPKEEMMERLKGEECASPDIADALSMTFAQSVDMEGTEDLRFVVDEQNGNEYDPLSSVKED